MRAVSNAGPLIHLSWLDRLDLLEALFDEIVVPVAVRDELLRADSDMLGVAALLRALDRDWLSVRAVADAKEVAALAQTLDRGEAEAVVLMLEADADVLLLDDRRARNHATRTGLPITGTLGLLRTARERQLIPAAAPLLDELRSRGFRISPALAERIRAEEREGEE